MSGDFDVQAKFRILQCGKYTNFILAINVVLLAACSTIFPALCPKRSSCLELWFARKEELIMRASEKERESFRRRRIYIYIYSHVTWPDPNARFVFAWDEFRIRKLYLKYRHVTTLFDQVPETNFFFAPIFVSGKKTSSHRQPFKKKYVSVNWIHTFPTGVCEIQSRPGFEL